MTPVAPILAPAFVAAFRAGTLTQTQIEEALPRDRAAVIFVLLQLSHILATGTDTPASTAHQPSGVLPPYQKPQTPPRRKKRGARHGHTGTSRPRPDQIRPPPGSRAARLSLLRRNAQTHRTQTHPHCRRHP